MDKKAEQYYPTYTFDSTSKEVVLAEFEEALKIANSQTKVYGQIANILLAAVTLLLSLIFDRKDGETDSFSLLKEHGIYFSTIIFLFGILILRYFVDLQKQITFNARKVVTLRTMLGLDYGHIQLTLPNWRVEGATNPFAIKFFTGWDMFQSSPFWVLTIGVNAVWLLTSVEGSHFSIPLGNLASLRLPWYTGNIIITASYYYVFRRNLNDTHESTFLNFGRLLARIVRFRLQGNFEYIIYRAKLAIEEMSRLQVKYDSLKSILVEIEDKSFYVNSGVSLRSLGRGTLSQVKYFREKYGYIESGGSTITMQLARTLFIPPNQNKYCRKFFEIWLSFWLRQMFTKHEILNLYIVSVRYDYGVMGLANALNHFFGAVKKKRLSPEESFVLVERLSNVTGTYRPDRVDLLLSKTNLNLDKVAINRIYATLIKDGKLKQ